MPDPLIVSTFKKAAYINNDAVADDLIVRQFKNCVEVIWRNGATGKQTTLEDGLSFEAVPVADVLKGDKAGLKPPEKATFYIHAEVGEAPVIQVNFNTDSGSTIALTASRRMQQFLKTDSLFSYVQKNGMKTMGKFNNRIFNANVNRSGQAENPEIMVVGTSDDNTVSYYLRPDTVVKK